MSPPPPPTHHHLTLLLLLTLLLTLLPPLRLASSSFPLPTIAIASLPSAAAPHHLACAYLPAAASTGGPHYQLSCASIANRSDLRTYAYVGAWSTPYSAVVAGDGYLCSAGPTNATMSMRWWDLADWERPSKRVYRGEPVEALSGGGGYVCGLVETLLRCWRWPGAVAPAGVGFSEVAVGGEFVCGLVVGSGEVRCYGEGEAVGREPRGGHMMLAAGERHACAVESEGGAVACWGEEAAVAAAAPPRCRSAVSAVAVGDAVTCVLWGNWTVECWPVAAPAAVAGEQFVALEARGKVVCGVLMTNYALVCWDGDGGAGGARKVFDRVLPGPCAPTGSCQCGVWSGSAPLCGGDGGAAICYPCGYTPPPSSNSSISAPPSTEKRRPSELVIAMICAGVGIALSALLAMLVVKSCLRRRRGSNTQDSGRIHAEPVAEPAPTPRVERRLSALLAKGPNTTVEQFPLAALRAATAGFSPFHRVGSGSFGTVYRALLPDGREVAIKRAERRNPASSSAAAAARRVNHEAAFASELALLSRVNHKNLVRLLGFCADAGERILVYAFMPNGALHDHLHKHDTLSPPLSSWHARLRLALDAARGIEYMHTYAVPPIIHRDIKSSNILLDESWTAMVADFGLSLLNIISDDNADDEPCFTAGTVGYIDPEYYRLQHLTDKSDVYSFGVVLLELMSGCKVIQRYEGSGTPKNVVDFAVPHIQADHVHRMLDQRLPLPTPGEMEAVAYVGYLAADCVRLAGRDRPTMSEVVGVLERAVAACEEYEADGEVMLSRSCTNESTTACGDT